MNDNANADKPQARRRRASSSSQYAGEVLAHVVDSVEAAGHDAVELVKEAYNRTLHWSQLEEWQKDNEYIVRGYRRCVSSRRSSNI